MAGSKLFEKRSSAWTMDRLAQYLKFRHELLCSGYRGVGGLDTGNKRRGGVPLLSDMYTHAARIGLRNEERTALTTIPTRQLLCPNPFRESRIRTRINGTALACWDSTLALPDLAAGLDPLTNVRELRSTRRVNTHWLTSVPAALARTGPLGDSVKRPSGAYIYDMLRANRDVAWDMLETAHALVHSARVTPVAGYFGELAPQFREAVAELVVATLYGLPVRIGGKEAKRRLSYGTGVVTCEGFNDAAALVPALSRAAPIPDESVAYVLAAMYTQPHPSSLGSGVVSVGKSDQWCGMPSVIALAGWETVEYITRQRVVAPPYARDVYYGVPAADLIPPDAFWAHLRLASTTRGKAGNPVFESHTATVARSMTAIAEAQAVLDTLQDDEDYLVARDVVWQSVTDAGLTVQLDEWYRTDHHAWLIGRTPPLPYVPCLATNRNAQGAPSKPRGRVPKGSKRKPDPDWARWFADTADFATIVEKAVRAYESRRYGYSAAAKRRRDRKAGFRKAEAARRDRARRAGITEKTKRGRKITTADRAFLSRVREAGLAETRIAAKLPQQYRGLQGESL